MNTGVGNQIIRLICVAIAINIVRIANYRINNIVVDMQWEHGFRYLLNKSIYIRHKTQGANFNGEYLNLKIGVFGFKVALQITIFIDFVIFRVNKITFMTDSQLENN